MTDADDSEVVLRRREFLQRTAVAAGLAVSMADVLGADTLIAQAARAQGRMAALPAPRNLPIDTFVVLMMENRSFDHYLGWLPGADGRQAGLTYEALDGRREPTRRFAPDFQGCDYSDPNHSWEGGREEVNAGRMDGFLRANGNDVFAISYYAEEDLPFIPAAARAFTTYDRFFCSVLGPTFPNRLYMHAGESYGRKDGVLPPGAGYPTGFPDTTIFAQLGARGIPHRYYFSDLPVSGLWGAQGMARASPVSHYYEQAATGTLPAVSFVDPAFVSASSGTSSDEHPHGDIRAGQAFMADVVHAFMQSPQWPRGALFIVYDEWGGFFDHVRPPRVPDVRASRDPARDFGQMGIRIPAVAVSPWARRGWVDHGVHGFESILKLICHRFGIRPFTTRIRYARNIGRSLDFVSPPRVDLPALPDPPAVMSQHCPNRPLVPFAGRAEPGAFSEMVESGWLERLGYEFRPATPDLIFREPSKLAARRLAADAGARA